MDYTSTHTSRQDTERCYSTQDKTDTHTAPHGATRRKRKALALLQELQQAEEQRLAELHTDYQPVPHLTRHEMMDNSQVGQSYKRAFQDNLPSPGTVVLDGDPYSLKNTESYSKETVYSKPCHKRALSHDISELDTTTMDKSLPELPGAEIDTRHRPTNPWQSGISYGDKRYQTLPGEAIPLSKNNT